MKKVALHISERASQSPITMATQSPITMVLRKYDFPMFFCKRKVFHTTLIFTV